MGLSGRDRAWARGSRLATDDARGAQTFEQYVRPLHLESGLAERQVDMLGVDVVESAAALASEVVVRGDVGVELPRPRALDHAEKPDLGQLPERVVDGRS